MMKNKWLACCAVLILTALVLSACAPGGAGLTAVPAPTLTQSQIDEQARAEAAAALKIKCDTAMKDAPKKVTFSSSARYDLIQVETEKKASYDLVIGPPVQNECKNSLEMIIIARRIDSNFYPNHIALDEMRVRIYVKGESNPLEIDIDNSQIGVSIVLIENFISLDKVDKIEVTFPNLIPYPYPTLTQGTAAEKLFWTLDVQGYSNMFN